MTHPTDDPLEDKIGELLSSDDQDIVEQGLELLLTLADPRLFDSLLEGFEWELREAEEMMPTGFGFFLHKNAAPHYAFSASTLLTLVAHAPMGSRGAELRTATKNLGLDYPGAREIELLAHFDGLEELGIFWPDDPGDLSATWTLPNLRMLRIDGGSFGRLPERFQSLSSLKRLHLEYGELTELDVKPFKALEALTIGYLGELRELRGLEELPHLANVELDSSLSLSSECLDALTRVPTCAAYAYEARSSLRSQEDDLTGAIEDISRVIDLAPTDELFERRAKLYSNADLHRECIADYTRAIEMAEKEDWTRYHNRAVAHDEILEFDAGEKDYRDALRVNPESTLSWMGLGGVLAKLGRLEEAIEAYTRGIELEPLAETEHTCVNNRGDAHFRLKHPTESLLDYQRVLVLGPSRGIGLINRAEVNDALEHFEFVIPDAERCLAVDPDWKDSANAFLKKAREARATSGNDGLPHQRIQTALKRFARTPFNERPRIVKEEASARAGKAYDSLLEGVEYVAEGIRRCGEIYGIVAVRPYPDDSDIAALLDFDRYLISLAPSGTKAAEERDRAESLFVGPAQFDVRSISQFKTLQRLWIHGAQIEGIDALTDLEALESIGFSDCEVTEAAIDVLSGLPQLRRLFLRRVSHYVQTEWLARLTQLRLLDIDSPSYIGTFESFAQLAQLEELRLPSWVTADQVPDAVRNVLRPPVVPHT